MATCTNKTMIFILITLLLLLCVDSYSVSGGHVQRPEGAANSANHRTTRRSDEGIVEVKPMMMMRKLLEDIDFQLDYTPPGANPRHDVPPPGGKGKP
ncbi:hypothetical protein SLA2020_086800 [Shorea laevis]